jgi:cell surface protein SprA
MMEVWSCPKWMVNRLSRFQPKFLKWPTLKGLRMSTCFLIWKLIWQQTAPIQELYRTVWCFEGQYNSRSPYTYGLFSISTVLIKTAFSTSDESASAFDDFRSNRLLVATRLASERGIDNNPNLDEMDIRWDIAKTIRQFFAGLFCGLFR